MLIENMENPGLQTEGCRRLIHAFIVDQQLALSKLGEALNVELQQLDRPPSRYLTLAEKAVELRIKPTTIYKNWKKFGGFKQAGTRKILFENTQRTPSQQAAGDKDDENAIEF